MKELTMSRPASGGSLWWRWSVLTGACGLAMALVVPVVEAFAPAGGVSRGPWFLVPVLWLTMVVPAAVVVHGPGFRAAWLHEPTEAGDYLRAGTALWGVLAAGVGLSLVACLLAGSAMPGIWPGAVMLMLLVLARPGRD